MDQFELELIPIRKTLDENKEFAVHPDCKETLSITIDYFGKIGFEIPWIGYYASIDHVLVGSAGFKGKPVDGRVEIAYGTFPRFRKRGVGTAICKRMVQLSLITDPAIRICARTLAEENYSSKILKKNNFKLLGAVVDEEDGEVWEWEFGGVKC